MLHLEDFENTYCKKGVFCMGYIIAMISGALMSIQGVWNTQLTNKSSQWVTNSFVQATALLVSLIAWFFTGQESFSKLFHISNKFLLLSGVLGAFITMTVIKSTASLGPAKAALLIVIAQLSVSYVIELFGLWGIDRQPFEIRKILGLLISIAGIIVFKWE